MLAGAMAGDVLAQEPGGPVAAQVAEESGLYLNIFWLLLVILCIGAWLYATGWVCEDATGNGLNFQRWATILLGTGGLGVLCMVLLHPAFGFALLAGVGAAFGLYVRERNEVVPEKFRLFSRSRAERVAGKLPDAGPGEGQRKAKLTVDLVNEAQKSLAAYLAGADGLAEPAAVLGDIIGRASVTHAMSARIEPVEEGYAVQLNMDGVTHNVEVLPGELGSATLGLLARFAQLGQKSKAAARVTAFLPGGEEVAVGVRAVKTPRGAAIVLELPDWTAELYSGGLAAVGMHKAMAEKLSTVLGTEGAVVAISGRRRSGRTTTFEAAIGAVDIFTTDVLTMSKTAEHTIEHVARHEVDLDSEEAFRKAFADVLRLEPNVIGVDELTRTFMGKPLFEFADRGGRLVTILQATSAGQAVQRILLSVDAGLVSGTLAAVLNQRLVRKLCPDCKEPLEPEPGLLAKLKIKPEDAGTWFRAVGCERCLHVGYLGRTALFEMLLVNDAVRKLVAGTRVTPEAVQKAAGKGAMRTLYQDGLLKVRQGVTSLEEVRRALK
jgi:type II secretory ATPase GspE/PulE/Tfp pilus assembly ATPase PilB-like protein